VLWGSGLPERPRESGAGRPLINSVIRSVSRRGSASVLEPPAGVAGLDDIAMVGQPVEHGGRHLGVAGDLRQSANARLVMMSSEVFSQSLLIRWTASWPPGLSWPPKTGQVAKRESRP